LGGYLFAVLPFMVNKRLRLRPWAHPFSISSRPKGDKMSKRDELIEKYAADMKEKCGVTPDMDFLRKVTIGCGPSIYNRDSSTVSATDASEIATVKNNFLIKKLGLKDGPELDKAIDAVMDQYGRSTKSKYRAVVYYLLAKHFNKESVYNK
jgi:hypothetical protein